MVFRDTDTVIGYGEHDPPVKSLDDDPDKSALFSIFDGVGHQVDDHSGDEGGVDLDIESFLSLYHNRYMLLRCLLSAGKCSFLGQETDVGFLQFRHDCLPVCPGQHEELVDKGGHTKSLIMDDIDSLAYLFLVIEVLPDIIALGPDNSYRSTKLVAGVVGKLFFSLEAFADPVKHEVEGPGSHLDFIQGSRVF